MHKVKCYYCGQQFDRDKEPCVQIAGTRRYAHQNCNLNNTDPTRQDQIQLEEYVKTLFKMEYVHPGIQKQINEYVIQKGFTYSGIYKTLVYYFDILGNKPFFSNPTIGIVPYVYPQAKEYYYRIYQAKLANKNKTIMKPTEIVVKIVAPEREPMQHKRKLFTFLDEGEE